LLQSHLDVLIDVLSKAEQNLRGDSSALNVDRQGVKQSQSNALAPELTLGVLHNAQGRSIVVRLVSIARAELPPPVDFLREAQRFLG